MKQIALFVLLGINFSSFDATAQKNWQYYFDQKYTSLCWSGTTIRENYQRISTSGNAYDFMGLSDIASSLMYMYVATQNEEYLNDEIKIINNVLSTAAVSKLIPGNQYPFKDDYLTWISRTRGYSYNNEATLYEGYIFRYITQFLYEIKKSGWVSRSGNNRDWYNSTLQFIEKNIWEKWITRSKKINSNPYGIFLGSRTDMASLWAFIGLVLKELTEKTEIKNQCHDVVNMYDTLLKRNLTFNPNFPDAYTWNSNWDNVEGTQGKLDPPPEIQDASHGNQVIAYIAISKRLNNPNWTNENIMPFCNTVKHVLFQKSTFTFADNVDGSASDSRPGWGNSNADGWLKLSLFDTETLNLFLSFAYQRQDLLVKYGQELQYFATLAFIEHVLTQ